MGRRLDLQAKLVDIVGSNKVYFQPPENIKLEYPCIVYEQDSEKDLHADDLVYNKRKRYLITVIDRNPDSSIAEAISYLPLCSFNRSYTKDNLNHKVYQLFF